MRIKVALLTGMCLVLSQNVRAESAAEILKQSGLTGGLIVHVGCRDGKLTAALGARDGYIVQGLDSSSDNVDKARKLLSDKKLGGRVTARKFDGKTLPYRNNTVNLVVAPPGAVSDAEITRVLAPKGVAIVGGKKRIKPRPEALDDWTHYHHDPQGTMVGLDKTVAPLHGIQWMAAPKWLRNHDFMTVMHAMVTSNGRVFYVIDEGLRNHILLPAKWVLIARDAFNGTVLWRRELKDWHPQNWPLKSGPGQFPRRLVAVGDRVYVTFGQTAPLTVIDAATGETIRTCKQTKSTEEIILDNGILYLLVNPNRKPVEFTVKSTGYGEIRRASSQWAWTQTGPPESVMAVNADSGKTLWTHKSKVAPLSLTLGEGKVFFSNGNGIVALNRKTGKPLWTSTGPKIGKVGTGGAVRAVYSDGVLVVANGVRTTALSTKDGKELWNGRLLHSSHHCPNDLFVIDGLIWSAHTGTAQRLGTQIWAIDLHTGKIKKDFKATNPPAFPMHPRCYPSRATTQYLLTNGMGTEFYKLGDTKMTLHHSVRGSCIYGIMPANGLLYKPPDTCACYYQSKLEYFCAMSPESALKKKTPEADRLETGPVYKDIINRKAKPAKLTDWPMYRRDPSRSGSTLSPITSDLNEKWSLKIGGKLTQPVISEGLAFVSSIPRQTLYAINTATGKIAWTFTAGGRIDSAPTIYNNTVLFGCGDGRVYCLRAEDGAVAWRYLVAPADVQMVSYQQVESVWPVHGAVLVVNSKLYALAGRNMFFDGGMRLVVLDPKTGKMISENMMDNIDPETGKDFHERIIAKYMPIANPDIFSSDGKRVYMQEQNFDLEGKRIGVGPTLPGKKAAANPAGKHLFCQTGLLDDAWFHRSFWIYGDDCGEGWGAYAGTRRRAPCGRIMSFDDKRIYGFRSDPLGNMLHPRTSYKLFCADKEPPQAVIAKPIPAPAPKARQKGKAKGKKPRKPRVRRPRGGIKHHWQVETPGLLVNAMVLGKGKLVLAGPPDLADETKMLGHLPGADDDSNRQVQAQAEAWMGKRGGLLRVVSCETGEKLSECKLDSVPLFDGMSAAEGKLFIVTLDGNIVCIGK
ncbi:MAG: PQQ-binding-like beta-propeller repeat protein [Phycisphaerae bacterium]|jgi:outer membrane protein assembly factor BamB|nr:PQQ-binding-like beta-propeller repeat protein [Phycisphaerae bacterium]